MFAQPTPFSRSGIGPSRLLCTVQTCIDQMNASLFAAEHADSRLTVWFPNPDDQWPIDAEGERLTLSVRDVAEGKIKHARLNLDGEQISRSKALAFLDNAAEQVKAISESFDSPWSHPKNNKVYTFTVIGEGGKKEQEGHSIISLRKSLWQRLGQLRIRVDDALKAHGYQPPGSDASE
jgi:hypothetical protein